jgi:GntR family carbon starvation induced transcriptional regulator
LIDDGTKESPLRTSIPSVAGFKSPEIIALRPPLPSQTDLVAFWLARDIIRGLFEPGERLKIEKLTRFYQIGHSPIREAILLLTCTGLVQHEHQKGYRVAGVSITEYRDLTFAYRRLYMLCLDMALERGDDTWEDHVVLTLHRTSKVPLVLPDGDPEARERWQLAYWRLHGAVLSGCKSPVLLAFISGIGDRLERYLNLFGDFERIRHRNTVEEHRALVDALMRRDATRVAQEFDAFFSGNEAVRNSVIESLQRRESSLPQQPGQKSRVAASSG